MRPFDRGAPAEVTADRVARKVRDGSIVLLHDGGADPETVVAAATKIIARLRANGYHLIGLDELLEDSTPGEAVQGCRPQ